MLKPLIRSQLVVLLLAWLLPTVHFTHLLQTTIVAITLLITMAIIKPVLKLLLLPLSVATLGSFSVLLNTGLFWFATFIVPGFTILPLTILDQAFGYWASLIITSSLYSMGYWLLAKIIR